MDMKDDPTQIADWLIDELGADAAKQAVLDGIMMAQDVSDNYGLSVWREVRQVLARKADDSNQG